MKYTIEPRKVAGVVVECNNVIKNMGFNHGEVVLGLAELIGRIIVDVSPTNLQADQLYGIAQDHMRDTIKAGLSANRNTVISQA